MKKKILSMFLGISMVVSMAAGCSGGNASEDTATDASTDAPNTETAPEESGEGGSITLMAPDWAIPTEEQLAEFKDEPGIEVVVNEVGWDDIRDKMVTAAAGGQAVADVVEVDWSWVGEFYAADWLEPLDVSDEVKADMPTLETFTKDGKVLAVPYANDYRLSYYNTKQYEDAGIKDEPQTWEEVYENCKTLKQKGCLLYTSPSPRDS